MDTQKATLTLAFNKFFGRKPGQQMADFAKEIKEATTADRAFWIEGLEQNGFEIIDK